MLKDCLSKAKAKPNQVKACMPLVQVTSESVPSMARVDHLSVNDADISPLETDETILSMIFNNSKLSIKTLMPNNVNDVRLHVTPLQYIDVVIDNVKCKCLCNSGAQISMINNRLVGSNAGSLGTMQVHGVVGDPVQAELVSLDVSCCTDGDDKLTDVNGPTQIVFAVTDYMTRCDVILPSTICDELRTAKPFSVIPNANCVGVNKLPDVYDSDEPQTDEQPVQSDTGSYDKGNDLSSLDIAMLGSKTVSHPTVSMKKVDVMKITKSDLADEQSKDLSLTSCFDVCSNGKGNFVLCDGLLYHDDHVLGNKVRQLCAPLGRRDHILKLAHDTVFGSHLAYVKQKNVFVYRFGGQSYRKMLLIIACLVHHASSAGVK